MKPENEGAIGISVPRKLFLLERQRAAVKRCEELKAPGTSRKPIKAQSLVSFMFLSSSLPRSLVSKLLARIDFS